MFVLPINFHLIKHFAWHVLTAKRGGHGIHSPFAYRLCEEVFYNNEAFYDFEALKKVRNTLLRHPQKININDLGAGSKTFRGSVRKIKDIAAHGVTRTRHSELFFKLIHFLHSKCCIELGTSIGLNTLYLAQANTRGQVYTLEGSSELSDFAARLATAQGLHNCHFLKGNFDDSLPPLLNTLTHFDLLYVDGNHTATATRRYFEAALEKARPTSVIIFDDIYWSRGMTQAWREIQTHPAVTLSIDAFYFGMVFFRTEIKQPTHLKLYIA